MIDWVIMGIIFATIAVFAVYIIWKNKQAGKGPLEKRVSGAG